MKYSTLWILTLFLIIGLKEKPKRQHFSESPILLTCPNSSRSTPCQKYSRIIDDIDIRNAFSRLWHKSRTNRSMKERREQGVWIVLND
ncbi:hypothetical protein NC796_25295 [Aliifodinibius sp. S!AR15-10]|uniref:hypothetical protein n=1 Tax=Aliifodinibius sp. S!AR15-10 TaxID=2950437 RepID=UPI002864F399|nr:hypothetical protein [Aliifodinibius sp. S!AR15-10]MDR8394486.1 hypothetical protein [Aliifodinibius sp. S!AR15-10]